MSLNPHSEDWKDGYNTGFAEGASGDFNPDGSYKAAPPTHSRVAEHYPGEPPPVEMLRDLQTAIYGHHVTSALSPQDEWQRLLALVRDFVAAHGAPP